MGLNTVLRYRGACDDTASTVQRIMIDPKWSGEHRTRNTEHVNTEHVNKKHVNTEHVKTVNHL